MSNPFDQFDAATPQGDSNPFDQFDAEKKKAPGSSPLRRIADIPLGLVKGIADLPGAAVGLADIPTNGLAGKAVDAVVNPMGEAADAVGIPGWVRPTQLSNTLGDLYSPEMKQAKQNVHEAFVRGEQNAADAGGGTLEKFIGGIAEGAPAFIKNPAAAVALATENYGGMKAIAKVTAKMLAPAAAKYGEAVKAGTMTQEAADAALANSAGRYSAVNEGLLTAGQNTQQVEHENPDASFADRAMQGVAGAITGGISRGVSKIPRLGDVEANMALRDVGSTAKTGLSGGRLAAAGKSAFSEGVLEELPQSMQEQVWQNLGTNKPWDSGLAEQAVSGLVAGGAMGGAMGALSAKPGAEKNDSPIVPIPKESINLVTDPDPLQERIDSLLGIGNKPMNDTERTQYAKDLESAFGEVVGHVSGKDGLEIPVTMEDYLRSQLASADITRDRPKAENAVEQSANRLQQLADEESTQQPDIAPPGMGIAAAPIIPVVGALSAAANLAVQTGAHASAVAQQAAAQAAQNTTPEGKAGTPAEAQPNATAPASGTLAGIAAMAPTTGGQTNAASPAQVAKEAPQADAPKAGATAAQATSQGQGIDLSNRTHAQLNYLSKNGKNGHKEAAIAELQRRGKIDAPKASADSESVPALKAADSAKTPAAPVEVNVEVRQNQKAKGEKLIFINGEQVGVVSRARSPGTSDWGFRGSLSGELHFTEEKAVAAETEAAKKHYSNRIKVAAMEAEMPPAAETKPKPENKKPTEPPTFWTSSTPAHRKWIMDASGLKQYNATTPWNRIKPEHQAQLIEQWGDKPANQDTIKNEKPAAATVSKTESVSEQAPIKKDVAVDAGSDPDLNIEKRILFAADSIDKLRKVDVERVLAQGNIDRQKMAEYIKRKRPDLSGEVDDVMAELQPSVSQPKTDAAHEAKQDKAPASKPKPARNKIDPEKDSMFAAIAKAGGMDTDELLSNGIDSNDITYETSAKVKKDGQFGKKRRMPISFGFALPLHKKGGMSFDGMREAMQQYGYLPQDATKNDAIDLFKQELAGDPVYTAQAIEFRRDQDQEEFDKQMAKEQDRIDAELAAQEIAEDDAGFNELSLDEQSLASDFAEFAFGENGKQDDNATRAGMRALGFTEEEINDELGKNSQAKRESEEIASGRGQESGNGRDGNGAQDAQARERGGEEGFDLAGQTNTQAADQFAQQQAGENDAPTKAQADRERDAVPFSLGQQSQPKPQGVQTGLFTADGRVSSEAKPAEQNKGNDADLEKRILIAADSIDKLRKVDVERVLTQGNIDREAMAGYIKRKRPELAGEVDDVMADIEAKAAAQTNTASAGKKPKSDKPPKTETVGDMHLSLKKAGYERGTLPMNNREMRVGLNMDAPFSDQRFEAVINRRGGQWVISEVETPELRSEGMREAMEKFRADLAALNDGKWPAPKESTADGSAPAPAAAEKTEEPKPADEASKDDWLGELFGQQALTPSATPSKPKAEMSAQEKADRVNVAIAMLTGEIEANDAAAAEMAARKYKTNRKQIELAGDGPGKNGSLSISAINESRKRRAIEASLNASSSIKQAIEFIAENPDGAFKQVADMESAVTKQFNEGFFGPSANLDRQLDMAVGSLIGSGSYSGEGSAGRKLRMAASAYATVDAKKQEESWPADSIQNQFNTMADIDSAITGIYDGTVSIADYKAADAKREEFIHNGVRIYPANVNVGGEAKAMWGVESFENKAKREAGERYGFGDGLVETEDQAKSAADRLIKDEKAKVETAAVDSETKPKTERLSGNRRDPTKVNVFNPYEDGDIVSIGGNDWQLRNDGGWYLTTTGNWRGEHPTIKKIAAMTDLIRAIEQEAVAKEEVAPAWHTKLPTKGLPITDDQRKPSGYGRVPNALADEAYAAITQNQLMNGMPMYAYYMPAANGLNGIVRLIPDDQNAAKPWVLLNGEAIRPAGQTKEQVVAKLTGWLRSAPVLGDDSFKPVEQSNPEPKKGDRFTDGEGNTWEIWNARSSLIEAHPVVDGKPVVNRDSGQRFATDDRAKSANPEARTDYNPIADSKTKEEPKPAEDGKPDNKAAKRNVGPKMAGDSGLGKATITPAKSLPFITDILSKENARQVTVKGGNADVLNQVANLFGKKIIFFRTVDAGRSENADVGAQAGRTGPDAGADGQGNRLPGSDFVTNGFVNPGRPDLVFLNVDSSNHLLYIVGHEVGHTLRMDDPALWSSMAKQLQPLIRRWSEYKANMGQKLDSDAAYAEELFGDIIGQNFLNQAFWNDLAKENQSLFKRIAQAAIKVLNKAMSLIVGQDVSIYVSDMEQARAIIAKTMAQYAEGSAKGIYAKYASQYDGEYVNKRMVAWHGSPHDHDKFDSSKIGTGEGAQAYGHGLYFAGRREVAEWYRDNLSSRKGANPTNEKFGGKTIMEWYQHWSDIADKSKDPTEFYDRMSMLEETELNWNPQAALNTAIEDELNQKAIDWFKATIADEMQRPGKTYQVELAPSEDEYLDWDKPLSEQSEKVQKALGIDPADAKRYAELSERLNELSWKEGGLDSKEWNKLVAEARAIRTKSPLDLTGGDFYAKTKNDLADKAAEGTSKAYYKNERWAKEASDYLHSIGIRGIRYLDGSSRGAGDGSRNYVIFNDADVSITAKYNVASQGKISPADKAIYGMAAEGKSAEDILKFIGSASRNPFYRQLAKLLMKTGISPTITVGDGKGWKMNAGEGNKYAAGYNPTTNTISLFRPASAERNMLHELVHAATLKALSGKGMASAQMNALYQHVKKSGKLKGMYGMANLDEFVAEVFSNPKFQAMLKQVSAMPVGGKPSSAWDWFVRVIRGILGLKQGQDNALSQALDIGVEVMREDMKLRNNDAGSDAIRYAQGDKRTKQTDSEAFRKWFGDSKVVDANGEPLVVYHGTASDITAFDIGRSGESTGNTGFYGAGAYFSEDADYASGFSFWARRSDDQAPNVVPVYLSLKNPAYINITPRSQAASEKSRATAEKIISTMIARGTDQAVVDKLQGFVSENKFEPFMGTLYNALGGGTGTTALLKEAGFDGVTIYGGISGKEKLAEAVAFDPTQIKSAIGNNGDFDGNNPDIRYNAAPGKINQTDTEAFKRWFGDSKVVDSDGNPMRAYHGTGATDINEFKVSERGTYGGGIYLTPDLRGANDYAIYRGAPSSTVYPVYAAIKNPASGSEAAQVASWKGEENAREELIRRGYDGVVDMRSGEIVAFYPSQVKSAIGNSGDFDGSNPDIRYNVADEGWSVSEQAKKVVMRLAGRPMADPSDPFAAENSRLREQDQSLWSKAKKQLRRYLAPGGLLPQSVFAEKIKRDSEFQAVEFDVRHLIGGLEQAVKADFGMAFDKLSKEQMRPITEALAGNVPASLPDATKTAAVAMRQYIDGMSTEYLKIIQQKIDTKMLKAIESGKDSDKVQAINEIELFEKIKGNIGRYVHRSYQAFDDPKWFEKVPAPVLNASRLYLKQGYMEAGETDAKAAQLAEVTLHEILKNGTAYDSMESFIAESKLGAKDLSVLMRRKEVPTQIRALLGEYPDARLNFTKSATKMGRLIWNTRFLDRVRDIGIGSFFFEGKDRPPEATTQIAAGGSEVYAPLNGLWTFPEIAQSFKDALGKEQMSDLYRAIVRANGLVKYGKTILAPTTAMRNWQSAMFFSLANGHFDLTQMKKSISAFREQVSQKATGQDLKYLRHLKQLGVVYDTPYAGEMARLMEDARMDELLSSDKGDAVRWFRKANQLAQGFYTFGDDFWKIIGFENEKAGLMKAGLSLQDAEAEAAKRIRDTYPTYSMVGRGVQWLSRFPLAGTFVSFPAEIIRTSSNMLRTVVADLKSDNPKLRELGMKRAAGMAFVSAAFYGLAALSMAMAGVGDDEDEAIRDLAPEWQKNSTFLYLGRDEKGNLRYFDMSFLDPYGYWKRPITAILRNQPWEDSLASGLRGMLEPFLGADISAKAIFEAVANQKENGSKVYKEKDGSIDQAIDIADHLRKALQPGVVGNVERLVKAAGDVRKSSGQPYSMEDELVALAGWRATTIDPKTALYYRSFDFTDSISEARKTLTDTLRDANSVSPEDIKDAKARAASKQEQAFKEMSRLIGAAEAAGMSKMQIVQTMRLSNISQANIAALMRGSTPDVSITPQLAARAVRQARQMRGPEYAAEVFDRYRQAMAN